MRASRSHRFVRRFSLRSLPELVPDLSLAEAFFWVAPAVGFIVHLTVGRYNARRVAEQWQALPTALDAERLGQLRTTVECDASTLDITMDTAREARSEGDAAEAVRLAGLAHKIVAEATPERLGRLKALSLFVRMAMAVTPMPPLRRASFRVGKLSSLAGLAAAFHFFLVTPTERVLLRIHVLRAGFRLIFHLLSRRRGEIERRPESDRAWQRFDDGASDFKTLDREHLDTARACLVSLRLEPRVEAFAQSAR